MWQVNGAQCTGRNRVEEHTLWRWMCSRSWLHRFTALALISLPVTIKPSRQHGAAGDGTKDIIQPRTAIQEDNLMQQRISTCSFPPEQFANRTKHGKTSQMLIHIHCFQNKQLLFLKPQQVLQTVINTLNPLPRFPRLPISLFTQCCSLVPLCSAPEGNLCATKKNSN